MERVREEVAVLLHVVLLAAVLDVVQGFVVVPLQRAQVLDDGLLGRQRRRARVRHQGVGARVQQRLDDGDAALGQLRVRAARGTPPEPAAGAQNVAVVPHAAAHEERRPDGAARVRVRARRQQRLDAAVRPVVDDVRQGRRRVCVAAAHVRPPREEQPQNRHGRVRVVGGVGPRR